MEKEGLHMVAKKNYKTVQELMAEKAELEQRIKEARAHEAKLDKECQQRCEAAIGRVVMGCLGGDWKGFDLDTFREEFGNRSEKFAGCVSGEIDLYEAEGRLRKFEGSLTKKKATKRKAERKPEEEAPVTYENPSGIFG